MFAFVLALILIYLVLAAQFESFFDPFTIMLTVPLALAGALLSLVDIQHTLNIFSEIGMIMLIGLVTKNGILIVEFANQRREQGLKKMEAVVEAASTTFAPHPDDKPCNFIRCIADCIKLGCIIHQPCSIGYRGCLWYFIFIDPYSVCNTCCVYIYIRKT